MKRFLVPIVLLAISVTSALAGAALESGGGLQAEYAADLQWGRAIHSRVDRQISTAGIRRAWNDSPPEQFRARWSGFLVVPRSGWYTFATTSDDGSRLTIDRVLVVDNGGDHPPQTRTGRIRLGRRSHAVLVEYSQSVGSFEMGWAWAREDATLSPVPAWALWTTPTAYWRVLAVRLIDPIPVVALITCGLVLFRMLWQQGWRGWLAPVRVDWALLLIILFGAYFRLQYIQLPMADAHGWRQITNADIARNFSEQSLNILYPRVSWGGGGEAYVGTEFPLIQWMAAVLFRVFGERDVICRSLAIAFSLGTLLGLYGLGSCLWGPAVGRGAAFLYAISPSAIFFGRTFISDIPMVCFSAFGVWGFASYLRTGRRAPLIWGTAAAALACLVKVPAVIIFAPIIYLAWDAKRWALLRDRALLGGLATVLLLTIAWYVHADILFHRTGLGMAIWHGSGGYSPDIMIAAGPQMTVSHWSTLGQLSDPEFYRTMWERLWALHLTPVGTVVIAVGAVTLWAIPKRRMVDVWVGTVVLFILVSAEGNRWHEFHQLPILLPAALYFGLGARPVFDGAWLGRLAPFRLGVVLAVVTLGTIGLESFDRSRAVPELFRPNNLRLRPVRIGQRLQALTPPGALLVTVEYEQFGGNSPVVLYHARRRGWSFDATAITAEVIQRLHTRYGARYFVTLIWSDLAKHRPDVAAYLKTQDEIPVDASDVALFALR